MFLTDLHALHNVTHLQCGQKYRPSNGTEGELFACTYCIRCKRWDEIAGCEISARTYAYDVDDPQYPTEWIIGGDGQPKCTAFSEIRRRERWDELLDQVSGIDTRPLDGHKAEEQRA